VKRPKRAIRGGLWKKKVVYREAQAGRIKKKMKRRGL
jgi:hypothetical protein